MATAILILFNAPECEHSNGVFEKQQCLHNQKLRTVVGQKYHPEWYFLTRPTQTDTDITPAKMIFFNMRTPDLHPGS